MTFREHHETVNLAKEMRRDYIRAIFARLFNTAPHAGLAQRA